MASAIERIEDLETRLRTIERWITQLIADMSELKQTICSHEFDNKYKDNSWPTDNEYDCWRWDECTRCQVRYNIQKRHVNHRAPDKIFGEWVDVDSLSGSE